MGNVCCTPETGRTLSRCLAGWCLALAHVGWDGPSKSLQFFVETEFLRLFRRSQNAQVTTGVLVSVSVGAILAITCVPRAPSYAQSQRIENAVAIFSALDKVTATIEKLEIPIGETMTFAALKVTPRVCLTSPATEQPKTTSFVQVDETQLDGSESRIFSGWMFSESPGLNAVEHPVFDVWLTGCKGPATRSAGAANPEASEAGEGDARTSSPPVRRRRIRR